MEIWRRTTFCWRGRARNRQVDLFFATYSKSSGGTFLCQLFEKIVRFQIFSGSGSTKIVMFLSLVEKEHRHFVSWNVCKSLSFETFFSKPIPGLNQTTAWSASKMRGIFWQIYIIIFIIWIYILRWKCSFKSNPKMRRGSTGTTIFLSEPGPIKVYACQALTHSLTHWRPCWRFNELTLANGIKYPSSVDIEMK